MDLFTTSEKEHIVSSAQFGQFSTVMECLVQFLKVSPENIPVFIRKKLQLRPSLDLLLEMVA